LIQRNGSLTAAAETLHLTQSALSHAVRKLEDQLGLAVWHREGRSLRPTQAGKYLLSVASRLLPQLEHAESQLGPAKIRSRKNIFRGVSIRPRFVRRGVR